MVETVTLRKTALNAVHRARRRRWWTLAAGICRWSTRGLVAEHMAVRTGVGVFDVSHMGDIQLRGPGSLAAVQQLCMNDASEAGGGAGALLGDAVSEWDVCGRRGGA